MQIKISDLSKTSLSLYRNDNDEFPILLIPPTPLDKCGAFKSKHFKKKRRVC